jgi:hypothetical protein
MMIQRRFKVTINLSVPNISSWRTTLVGLISAFVAAWQGYNDASFSMAIRDPKVQTAVLVAIIGILAKDSNVTGGTKAATPEAKARIASQSQP